MGKCWGSVDVRSRVEFGTAESFVGLDNLELKGDVSPEFTYIIRALLEETALILQVSCFIEPELSTSNHGEKKIPLPFQAVNCSLAIILYGRVDLFDDIGDFFQTHNIYLQDPILCDHNVRYYNPHRLSSVGPDKCPLTFDLESSRVPLVALESLPEQPELLEILASQRELAEAPQPGAIQTTLER